MADKFDKDDACGKGDCQFCNQDVTELHAQASGVNGCLKSEKRHEYCAKFARPPQGGKMGFTAELDRYLVSSGPYREHAMSPVLAAVIRHYLDAYAGLMSVLLVTLLAVYASTSGSVVFLFA